MTRDRMIEDACRELRREAEHWLDGEVDTTGDSLLRTAMDFVDRALATPRDEPAGDAKEWLVRFAAEIERATLQVCDASPVNALIDGYGDLEDIVARLGPPPFSAPLSPPVDAERERDRALVRASDRAADANRGVSAYDYVMASDHYCDQVINSVDADHPRTAPREPSEAELDAKHAKLVEVADKLRAERGRSEATREALLALVDSGAAFAEKVHGGRPQSAASCAFDRALTAARRSLSGGAR